MLCTMKRLIFTLCYVHLSIAAVQDKFAEHGVVSDVVQRPPKNILRFDWRRGQRGSLEWGNRTRCPSGCEAKWAKKPLFRVNYGGQSANLGNELNSAETKKAPSLDWNVEPGALYTIAMVDPDAPSRKHPLAREWRHWLVVNVKNEQISSGRTLTSYHGPSPPPSSGPHRYVLLVYKQKAEITDNEWSDRNRPNWRVASFASKHQLGDPVAGNFFLARG